MRYPKVPMRVRLRPSLHRRERTTPGRTIWSWVATAAFLGKCVMVRGDSSPIAAPTGTSRRAKFGGQCGGLFLGEWIEVGESGVANEFADVWVLDFEDLQAPVLVLAATIDAAVGVQVAVVPVGGEGVVLAGGVFDVGVRDFPWLGGVGEVDQRSAALQEGLAHQVSSGGGEHGPGAAGA